MPKKPSPHVRRKQVRKKKKSVFSAFAKKLAAAAFSTLMIFGAFFAAYQYFSYKFVLKDVVFAESSQDSALINSDIFSYALLYVDNFEGLAPELDYIEVVVFNTIDEEMSRITVPVTTLVDMPGRFGKQPLNKSLAFSTFNRDGDLLIGASFVTRLLEEFMGYEIDRFIVLDTSLKPVVETAVFTQKKQYYSASFLKLLTDKSLIQGSMSEIRDALGHVKLFKHLPVVTALPADNYLQDLSYNSLFALEKKNITILNATKTSGLAGQAARVVRNRGGKVLMTGNSGHAATETLLIVDDLASYSAKYLTGFFNIPVENILLKSHADFLGLPELHRSDILLIIAE